MDPFRHKPINLEGHSFRLLRLCKAEFGNVRCELIHAYLDDENLLEYEALSYTWGGTFKAHDIEVDGTLVAVTQNLSLALRSLRNSNTDRILWIDAICIDQDNDKERGHQVCQMGAIYAKAERVLIWLGPATPETDLAFDNMRRFEKESSKYACRDWKVSDKRWEEIMASVQPPDGNGKTTTIRDQMKGLEDLMARTWFDRVWIIQEVTNARAAKVACGTRTVLARTFALFPNLCGFTPSQHCQAILDVMPGPTRENSWWKKSHDLNTLLLRFRGSHASDPRDKIYALLGISSDHYMMDFPAPDYEKSETEVIQATVTFLLQLRTGSEQNAWAPAWTLTEFMQRLEHIAGETCVWAAGCGSVETVKLLLGTGNTDPNFSNKEGQTALLRAAEEGHESIVKLLLDTGKVEVNNTNKKYGTPLMRASKNGHARIAKLLIEIGKADVNVKDMYGQTPLLEASRNGDKTVLKHILDTGASDTELSDRNGWNPLFTAAISGHEAIVHMLLQMKDKNASTFAQKAAIKKEERLALELLETHKADYSSQEDQLGQHPLAWSMHHGYMKLFEQFIETAPVDLDSTYFRAPYPVAKPFELGYWREGSRIPLILWAAMTGLEPVVAALLGTIKTPLTSSGEWAKPLLQLAVQNGDVKTVQLVLSKHRENVLPKALYGCDLIVTAVIFGHLEVVELLLDSEMSDEESEALAFQRAADTGCLSIAKRLLDTGKAAAYSDRMELTGRPALFQSAWNGDADMVKLLLEMPGIKVDRRHRDFRQTPLSVAAEFGHANVVRLLLETNSVDLNSTDTYGRTALDHAKRGGHWAVVRLLTQAIASTEQTTMLDYAKRGGHWVIVWLLKRYLWKHAMSSTQAIVSAEQTTAKTSTDQSILNLGKEAEGKLQSKLLRSPVTMTWTRW